MEVTETDHPGNDAPVSEPRGSLPVVRSAVGGILMGLANLVPGISGGTMILIMGLYDEFIGSVANATRLRFTKRSVAFLAIVGCAAIVAIAALAETFSHAVTLHRAAMYSLFIGMTLGGTPVLIKMLHRLRAPAVTGLALGIATMLVVAVTMEEPPDHEEIRAAAARGELVVRPAYERDLLAGALGMTSMVLPGISGAYMLLILGRYETILAAVSMTKSYALSWGGDGDPAVFLRVMVPTAIGAVFSLVFLSNVLKWVLRRHREFTVGLLLGLLLGSVVKLWPFDPASQPSDYALGAALALSGFAATLLLSRISA
jgi:putative membrane protein